MALGIVVVVPEVVVMVEVPTRELAGRDAARARVDETERAVPAVAPAVEDGAVDDLVKSVVMLKNVKPCSTASGTQTSGFVSLKRP